MSNELVRKNKWFWAWADDKEEAWLRQMARQGLHLVKAAPFGKYLFTRGERREVVYRLDYIPSSKKDENYYQLFQDAGWEHAGEMMGWQYWRKPVPEGGEDEIFTDAESKVEKYKRLIAFLGLMIAVCFVNLTNYVGLSQRYHSVLIQVLYAFLFFMMVFFIYGFIRLWVRIKSLERL